MDQNQRFTCSPKHHLGSNFDRSSVAVRCAGGSGLFRAELEVQGVLYEFECSQERGSVLVTASRADGNDSTEKDCNAIGAFLAEMGKWEMLASTIANLLGRGVKFDYPYGPERYEIETEAVHYHVSARISLEAVERRSRPEDRPLSLAEIRSQIENIPKWIELKKTFAILFELKRG